MRCYVVIMFLLGVLRTFVTCSDYVISSCCRKPDSTTLDCSNCRLESVPYFDDEKITTFYLNDNLITNIADSAFAKLPSLEYLSLRKNKLQTVNNNSFAGLKNLKTLDMYQEYKYTISQKAFKPMTALETLKLGNICPDPTCKFPYDAFTHVSPTLRVLELAVKPRFVFGEHFAHLKNLETLVLFGHSCSLRRITNETFANFATSLKTLEVHDCELFRLDEIFLKPFTKLETLNLACNGRLNLTKAFDSVKNMPAATLHTFIGDGSFTSDLNYLKPSWFDSPMFRNLKRLSLRLINLIAVDFNFMHLVPNLRYLNAGYNSILKATPSDNKTETELIKFLDKHNLTSMDISYLGQAVSASNIFREKYCRDADLYSDDFFRKPPPYIDVPQSVPCCNHTFIHEDNMEDMLDQNVPQSLLYVFASSLGFPKGKINSVSFNTDNNVIFLDFSRTQIESIDGVFHGLFKLQGIDLSACDMNYINPTVLDYMPSLRYINLSNNELMNTQWSRFFRNATSMRVLDLRANRIRDIPSDIFSGMPSLETALLNDNALGKVNIDLKNNDNLTLLDLRNNSLIMTDQFMQELVEFEKKHNNSLKLQLGGNIFQCDCNTLDFLKWLKTTNINLVDKNSLQCYYKKKKTHHYIIDVDVNELDYSCNKMKIVAMTVTPAVTIVGVLLLVILMHNYRWSIRWRFYLLRRSLRHRATHRDDAGVPLMLDNASYNAFVSYNHTNDYEWVQDTLLPKVEEEWGLRLCIGQRDFIPGIAIAENICDAIDNSRYVILVVTPSFAASQWCDFEMHMALVKGRRHMIMIYKEEVDLEEMSKTMRAIMSSLNYIEYSETEAGQELFWARLRDALTGHIEDPDV